jgi:hypothetical protein
MRLAKGRAVLEADSVRARNLSLAGALRLLGPANPRKGAPPRPSRSKASLRWPGRHDALGWWAQAPVEERRDFIDAIGRTALLQAVPPTWRAKLEADLVPVPPAALPLMTAIGAH